MRWTARLWTRAVAAYRALDAWLAPWFRWPRVTKGRVVAAAFVLLLTGYGVADWLTLPPILPRYDQVRGDWQPSEAWLYDRQGRLLDSSRVNFKARRLGWTALKDVAPSARDAILASEDKRFYGHGGIDWLALAGAVRDRLTGHHARGASTLGQPRAGMAVRHRPCAFGGSRASGSRS